MIVRIKTAKCPVDGMRDDCFEVVETGFDCEEKLQKSLSLHLSDGCEYVIMKHYG